MNAEIRTALQQAQVSMEADILAKTGAYVKVDTALDLDNTPDAVIVTALTHEEAETGATFVAMLLGAACPEIPEDLTFEEDDFTMWGSRIEIPNDL